MSDPLVQYRITYHTFAGDHRHDVVNAHALGEAVNQHMEDGHTVVSVDRADLPSPSALPEFSVLVPEYTGARAVQLDGLKKADGVKVRFDLIPAMAELEIARIFTIGAMKYDADQEDVQNWMHPSRTHRMMYSASRRHLESRRLGEIYDADMKCHHLAASIVDQMMMLEADLRGWTDKDNFDPACLKRPGVTQ